jgi:hypothetical protein
LLYAFEDMFLALVKRISDSEEAADEPSTAGPAMTLQRAKSKVDVSATSLLLRGAFDVVFHQIDNFLYASHALNNDKTLCADGADQDIFYLSSMAQQEQGGKPSAAVSKTGPAEITKTELCGTESN